MKLSIFGSGYVGLVTATCFAEMGHKVICCDIDDQKINDLKEGHVGIYEPRLTNLVKKNLKSNNLSFSSEIEKTLKFSNFRFVCVGTPENKDGSANLNYVFALVDEILEHNKFKNSFLVMKSTVPPGTAKKIHDYICSKKANDMEISVASNPEFLREGSAVNDFQKPDRIIIGTQSPSFKKKFNNLYKGLSNRIIYMDEVSAELTKYAANAMLATKISFINEISNISELMMGDIESIKAGIGSDKRIGNSFINPGPGYGGSCFPKDVQALIHAAQSLNYDPSLLIATDSVNDLQKHIIFNKIYQRFKGNLKGKKIAIWGVAFKANTDDVRESPAITLVQQLMEAGCLISIYDPKALKNFKGVIGDSPNIRYCNTRHECIKAADSLAIMTEWDEFKDHVFKFNSSMSKKIVFDSRNIISQKKIKKNEYELHSMGRIS
ncbi:UDP-glucose/GDP-mannose dehydrogenase family protein [Gammaproteobacteria bacterium]|nr:UDP-glucose/GDP-mannose dehydrogenase family protein [Gammaproteobacteria bacterium]